jgi:predicted SprT family Zn-dependent metalloprotease
MNLLQIYLHNCQTCKKQTPQRIAMAHRKKGVKLVCLKCGQTGKRYQNLNSIKIHPDINQ